MEMASAVSAPSQAALSAVGPCPQSDNASSVVDISKFAKPSAEIEFIPAKVFMDDNGRWSFVGHIKMTPNEQINGWLMRVVFAGGVMVNQVYNASLLRCAAQCYDFAHTDTNKCVASGQQCTVSVGGLLQGMPPMCVTTDAIQVLSISLFHAPNLPTPQAKFPCMGGMSQMGPGNMGSPMMGGGPMMGGMGGMGMGWGHGMMGPMNPMHMNMNMNMGMGMGMGMNMGMNMGHLRNPMATMPYGMSTPMGGMPMSAAFGPMGMRPQQKGRIRLPPTTKPTTPTMPSSSFEQIMPNTYNKFTGAPGQLPKDVKEDRTEGGVKRRADEEEEETEQPMGCKKTQVEDMRTPEMYHDIDTKPRMELESRSADSGTISSDSMDGDDIIGEEDLDFGEELGDFEVSQFEPLASLGINNFEGLMSFFDFPDAAMV